MSNAAAHQTHPKPRPVVRETGGGKAFVHWDGFAAEPFQVHDLMERDCFSGEKQRNMHAVIAFLQYADDPRQGAPKLERMFPDDRFGPWVRIPLEELSRRVHCDVRNVMEADKDAVAAGIWEKQKISGENWYRLRPDQYHLVVPYSPGRAAQESPQKPPGPKRPKPVILSESPATFPDGALTALPFPVTQVWSEAGEPTPYETRTIGQHQAIVLLSRQPVPEQTSDNCEYMMHTSYGNQKIVDSQRLTREALLAALFPLAQELSRRVGHDLPLNASLINKLLPLLPKTSDLDRLIKLALARSWKRGSDQENMGVLLNIAREDLRPLPKPKTSHQAVKVSAPEPELELVDLPPWTDEQQRALDEQDRLRLMGKLKKPN